MSTKRILYSIYDTDYVGKVILWGEGDYLSGLEFFKENIIKKGWIRDDTVFKEAINELKLYFKGSLKEFKTPVKPDGTNFQKRVWRELQKIPYGTTISYQELAKRIGSPKASRAVGNANGKNPIAIIIPCHRVILSSGELGGYSSPTDIKRKLLKLEGVENV